MTSTTTSDVNSTALDLVAGATAALVTTVATVSFASLVFSGKMAPFLAEGTTLALLSGVLLPLFGLGLYRAPALILIPNPVAPIVALVVAAAVASLPADAAPAVVYANGVAALMASTLFTGGFMAALGRLRLVAFSRFLPYPILIGMFGAVGWLFVAGTPGILRLSGPADLLTSDLFKQVLSLLSLGLAAALLLLPGFAPARLRSAVVPSVLVLFFALFHAGRVALGLSLADLSAAGGLVGAPAGGGAWLPLLGPSDLALIEPRALLAAPWEMISLAVLTAIKATLMLGAIEAQTKLRLSAERDMEWAGLGSMLVSPLGGYPGHVSISMSAIVNQLGGRTAIVFVGYLAVAGCAFLGGATMLAWLPVPMIAGVLLYLGLTMLSSALITERRKMSRSEFAIVALLVIVQAAVGFLSAILVGLLAAIGLFIFEYSRIETVARAWTGRERQSSIQRTHEQRLLLLERGDRLRILELRGYLFFGTSERLIQTVEQALAEGAARTEQVILDFRSVSGMDVSSAACFEKIAALADRRSVRIALSALRPEMEAALRRVGVIGHPRVSLHADLDRALEEAEERLLQVEEAGTPGERLLAELGVLADVRLAAGARLFARGESISRVHVLTRGRIALRRDDAPEEEVGPGAVLGAGAQLAAIEAPFTAAALEDCQLFAFDAEALRRIEDEQPRVAHVLRHLITERSADMEDRSRGAFDDLLGDHMVERRVPAGATLIQQGEALDCMYFVVDGKLDVVLAGSSARVRAIGPGDVLGEISYYAHSAATASVVARTDAVVHQLDREALRRLAGERPGVAAAFHQRFAQVLARRFVRDTLVKSHGD